MLLHLQRVHDHPLGNLHTCHASTSLHVCCMLCFLCEVQARLSKCMSMDWLESIGANSCCCVHCHHWHWGNFHKWLNNCCPLLEVFSWLLSLALVQTLSFSLRHNNHNRLLLIQIEVCNIFYLLLIQKEVCNSPCFGSSWFFHGLIVLCKRALKLRGGWRSLQETPLLVIWWESSWRTLQQKLCSPSIGKWQRSNVRHRSCFCNPFDTFCWYGWEMYWFVVINTHHDQIFALVISLQNGSLNHAVCSRHSIILHTFLNYTAWKPSVYYECDSCNSNAIGTIEWHLCKFALTCRDCQPNICGKALLVDQIAKCFAHVEVTDQLLHSDVAVACSWRNNCMWTLRHKGHHTGIHSLVMHCLSTWWPWKPTVCLSSPKSTLQSHASGPTLQTHLTIGRTWKRGCVALSGTDFMGSCTLFP